MTVLPKIMVQAEDLDSAAEIALLTKAQTDVGAVATFTGLCRSESESLSALELEHYPGMAERQLERVAGEAIERWPVDGLTVVHRFGKLEPGAQIVLVIATSRHRDAAFDACRYVMDFLKTDAPFWKKEVTAEGADWVASKQEDEDALKQWEQD